jgi:hypothetical protein
MSTPHYYNHYYDDNRYKVYRQSYYIIVCLFIYLFIHSFIHSYSYADIARSYAVCL